MPAPAGVSRIFAAWLIAGYRGAGSQDACGIAARRWNDCAEPGDVHDSEAVMTHGENVGRQQETHRRDESGSEAGKDDQCETHRRACDPRQDSKTACGFEYTN